MTTESDVNYVKSHIQSDIDLNKALSGRDYSRELGTALSFYLGRDLTPAQRVLGGLLGIGELEQRLAEESGKMVCFHETMKAVGVVSRLVQENNKSALETLSNYATELTREGNE